MKNGVANAISMSDYLAISEQVAPVPTLTFAAEEGREIRFNDPITSRNEHSDRPLTLTLNRCTDEEGKVHDTNGTIVFSGELYQGMKPTSLPAATTTSWPTPPSMVAPSC
ncbi:hypothetical protein M5E88_07250 [Akkermansia muciniphila]|nr:hypothetical protein M5E88_07250 [Akkermansia muciniphila]